MKQYDTSYLLHEENIHKILCEEFDGVLLGPQLETDIRYRVLQLLEQIYEAGFQFEDAAGKIPFDEIGVVVKINPMGKGKFVIGLRRQLYSGDNEEQ